MALITDFKAFNFTENPIYAVYEFTSPPNGAAYLQVSLTCVINGVTKYTSWIEYFDSMTNIAVVRVDEYLSGMMARAFDMPEPASAIPFDCLNSIGEFEVTCYEYNDGGGNFAFTSTGKQVVRGGLPFEVFPDTDYLTDIYSSKKFLTWHPDGKKVSTTSKEHLYFPMVFSGSTSFKTVVTLTYTDGTTASFDAFTHSLTGVTPLYQMFGVPVGYTELDIASHLSGKTVWYYDVVMKTSGGTALTESRRYFVDYDYYHSQRVFYYLNSLNGVDSLIATGPGKKKSAITSQTMGRIVPHSYSVSDGQRIRTNVLEQRSIKVSTSFKTFAEVDAYRDLLLSKQIVEEVNGRFLPIEIIPGTFSLPDESEFLPSLEFEYKYLFQNSVFAP